MVSGNLGGRGVNDIVNAVESALLANFFIFSLPDESRNEVDSHTQLLLRSQDTLVDKDSQAVSLEHAQVVLSKEAGQHLLLSVEADLLLTGLSPLLQDPAVLLLILTGVGGLHSLSLDELTLSELLELRFVLLELLELPLLDHLDLGLVERFANQNLQNGFCLHIKVKDGLRVNVVLFVNSVKLRNKDRIRGHIDKIVRLYLKFINLSRSIRQFFPVVAHHVASVR